MDHKQDDSGWAEPKPTALLVLADGTVLEGHGLGATGHAVGEVCFNTAMTAFGMPFSRIRPVSARVSMPASPMMPRRLSHWSRCAVARQFDGSVMAVRRITPRAPGVAAMFTVSMSSSLVPTLPICGNVKVMICPA